MANWDDEDFEVNEPEAPAVRTDKWAGEDEDDVKDDWDADTESEDEKSQPKEEASSEVKAVPKKKKKKLHEIIAEKEAAKEKELEEKMAEMEADSLMRTPEGKLAEKLRLQKLAEDQDYELAKELAGESGQDASGINFNPKSTQQFDELRSALMEKFSTLESSDHYQDFACDLIKEMCMNLSVPSLKKVKAESEGFISAKLKEERAAKSKKGKSGPKATIKMETDRSMFARGMDDGFNDMDDFM